MGTSLLVWLLLMTSIKVSIQHCTIEESKFKIKDRLSYFTNPAMIIINNIYYNCLSRSDAIGHYSSMSVSILYIRSHDLNNIHEVRYNLKCNNSAWQIVGNQSTALRNNKTKYCEDCTDQTVNEYHCTSYVGKWIMECLYIVGFISFLSVDHPSTSTDGPLYKKHLINKRQSDGKL